MKRKLFIHYPFYLLPLIFFQEIYNIHNILFKIMLSSWLGGNTSKNEGKPSSSSVPGFEINSVVKQVLSKIEQQLDSQIGEPIHKQISSITEKIVSSQILQQSLLETKQKYNSLVDTVEKQHQSLRSITNILSEFIKFIAQSFNSEDLLIPLKDIEKSIQQLNVFRVQKQFKYLNRLYESALNDMVRVRVNNIKEEMEDQLILIRSLNKNLQTELFRVRRQKSQLQTKFTEIKCRNEQMNEKINIIEKLGLQNYREHQNKQKEKFLERQTQLQSRIKTLEMEKAKLQKDKKQAQVEVIKSGSSIEVMRKNQENIIQTLQDQVNRKQKIFQQKILKLYHERSQMEEKIEVLESELKASSQTVKSQEDSASNSKKFLKQIEGLKDKIAELQDKKKQIDKKMEDCVSKDILKNLFLNYEDQSKEWSIRRDIKNQIYTTLGILVKQEEKNEEKKWFGLF